MLQKYRVLQSRKELRGKLMQRFLATLPLLAATISPSPGAWGKIVMIASAKALGWK